MSYFSFYKSENAELVYIRNTAFVFEEHTHSRNYVISKILNGTVVLHKEGYSQCLSKNGIFTICPDERHSVASECKAEMISLCINKDIIYNSSQNEYESFINRIFSGFPVGMDESFKAVVLRIHSSFHGCCKDNGLFQPLRERLDTVPERNFSIDLLAKEIFISKYYFIRSFKKAVGLTPHKYQIQNRIRKSQRLLSEGNSIAEIAYSVGFYDQSHFEKCFKRIVGITPSEYKLSLGNFLQDK
ncbi:MAG: helix-turn-helix transcriptional regulator [Oscillospiraceae bacterium]|nr:helix-turn-helix transcriptional regulator [Oscillospiraceae bacterium]